MIQSFATAPFQNPIDRMTAVESVATLLGRLNVDRFRPKSGWTLRQSNYRPSMDGSPPTWNRLTPPNGKPHLRPKVGVNCFVNPRPAPDEVSLTFVR
jgi:hypothetical protein